MPSGLIMMYVRSVSNLPAKTARFPREPALAATDLSARSATASATERMERRAAELVLEAGAAKAAAAEARWALTGARAEATTRVAEAETAKDIVCLVACGARWKWSAAAELSVAIGTRKVQT